MKRFALCGVSLVAVFAMVGTWIAQVKAGPDLVKFPENYASAVKYGVVSNPKNKLYRELYTTQQAVAAVKSGKPIPTGTWFVMKSFKSKQDASGNPIKGPDGHFVKDELAAYAVMEKRTGWGTEYPAALRNGEWEYQAFSAKKTVNAKANLKACFECHKPKEADDFLFSVKQLKSAK